MSKGMIRLMDKYGDIIEVDGIKYYVDTFGFEELK